MNDEMRSDAVDRQLAGRHEALIRDLANTLDLDAGLNAALLPGGYADLIEDVRNVLDVDAGSLRRHPFRWKAPNCTTCSAIWHLYRFAIAWSFVPTQHYPVMP